MRLIDADTVLELLDELCVVDAIYDKVKEIPTAYDPDKVVDELYEKAFTAYDTIAVSIDDAIEIVKSGGVADET